MSRLQLYRLKANPDTIVKCDNGWMRVAWVSSMSYGHYSPVAGRWWKGRDVERLSAEETREVLAKVRACDGRQSVNI